MSNLGDEQEVKIKYFALRAKPLDVASSQETDCLMCCYPALRSMHWGLVSTCSPVQMRQSQPFNYTVSKRGDGTRVKE